MRAPGCEDCRAHDIGSEYLYVRPWSTRTHTKAVEVLFSCHAEPGLLHTESA